MRCAHVFPVRRYFRAHGARYGYGRMATVTELSVNVFLRNGIQLNDLLM